jgi:hypothetical protein
MFTSVETGRVFLILVQKNIIRCYLLDVHLLKTGARSFQVSVKDVCYPATEKGKNDKCMM